MYRLLALAACLLAILSLLMLAAIGLALSRTQWLTASSFACASTTYGVGAVLFLRRYARRRSSTRRQPSPDNFPA